MTYNILTKEEERIIVHKGTEKPFTGEYNDFYDDGVYLCKRCNNVLFESQRKFKSGCGWPSFDGQVKGSIKKKIDGLRIEIVCSKCEAHLGHVFYGEFQTIRNTRHCVNSLSLRFAPYNNEDKSIVLGGGCFWCLDSVYRTIEGIKNSTCGYSGGHTDNPTYEHVSRLETGHAEVVRLEYDEKEIALAKILEIFFKIHDPTTINRQGNDVGTQYRSIIFYNSMNQKKEVEDYITKIKSNYENPIVTEVVPLIAFFKAEDYHQDYFKHNPNNAYCKAIIPGKVEKARMG